MDNPVSSKRENGQVLRSKERQIVVKVFNYLKRLNPDKKCGLSVKPLKPLGFRKLRFLKFVVKVHGAHW
jgi:hypothetical protein